MTIANTQMKSFLRQLYQMSDGDTDTAVSMYDIGAILGLEKSAAGTIAEDLIIDGYAELKTLSGGITMAIPDDVLTRYLGPGLPAMLLMLAVGIPLYICATASTPIAAALAMSALTMTSLADELTVERMFDAPPLNGPSPRSLKIVR